MSEVAETFRGKVTANELISEYDHNAKCLRMLCRENNRKYARLQEEAYRSIKEKDPDVMVLHGGTVRKNIPFMKVILEAGVEDFTDALVIHLTIHEMLIVTTGQHRNDNILRKYTHVLAQNVDPFYEISFQRKHGSLSGDPCFLIYEVKHKMLCY